jgi:hypothetical protein
VKKYNLNVLLLFLLLAFMACDTGGGDPNGEEPGQKPVLNTISPTSAFSHWQAFTLTCQGSDFLQGASIVFNNKEIAATYVSANELTCTINPDDTVVDNTSAAAALNTTDTDIVKVFVKNPSSSTTPLESEKLDFTLINNHTFAAPIKLRTTVGTHFTPEMKCDSQGNIYVIFADDGIWMIKSTDKGNNWTNGIRIEKITPCSSPKLYIDKNDDLYLIYAKYTKRDEYDQIYYSRSTNRGNSWSKPLKIESAYTHCGRLDIAVNTSGVIVAAWEQHNRLNFSRSTDSGSTWSLPVKISTSAGCGSQLGIAADVNGNFNLVFEKDSIDFVQSTDNGISWSAPVRIGEDGKYPCISTDSRGYLYVAWLNENDEIYFRSSQDSGATWSNSVSTGKKGNTHQVPAVAVDSLFNIYLVFTGETSDQASWFSYCDDIYYCRSINSGTNWTNSAALMNQPGFFGIFSPCVQVDAEGIVYALWSISFDVEDFPPEETHIYFTRSEDL